MYGFLGMLRAYGFLGGLCGCTNGYTYGCGIWECVLLRGLLALYRAGKCIDLNGRFTGWVLCTMSYVLFTTPTHHKSFRASDQGSQCHHPHFGRTNRGW